MNNNKKLLLTFTGSALLLASVQIQAVTVHNLGQIGAGISDKSHRPGRAGTQDKAPVLPGAAPKSWGDDDSRVYKAWGHNGEWYAFEATQAGTINLSVIADDKTRLSPAITVYTSNGLWNGENNGGAASFNQVGVLQNDDIGATWFKEESRDDAGVFGNGTSTLGYANSGKAATSEQTSQTIISSRGRERTGYGQAYITGWEDLDLTDDVTVTGMSGEGMAKLTLTGAEAGWYYAFIGGADRSQAGGDFTLTVSSVPVPGAVYLFGSSLFGLAALRRKKA